MDLRDAIQRIALEWPSYGRPRITAALRRQGWMVNPKRVYRLLREDNLLCVRKRKFVVTTDSNHNRQVYPNLAERDDAQRHQPALGGRHHLHSAGDGVRVSGGGHRRLFASRDWLGAGPDAWRMICTLAALRMALELRRPAGRVGASFRSRQPVCIGTITPTC